MRYFQYLVDLHRGNPFAFWVIAGFFVLFLVVVFFTPPTENSIDAHMNHLEEKDFRRSCLLDNNIAENRKG